MKETNKISNKAWGVMIPGCMFVGLGLGYVFGSVATGLFIGMGIGFLLTGILSLKKRRN